MRIRKNASKPILGSATFIYSSAIESPSNAVAFASEAEEVICELNCSPWDVMLFDNISPNCSNNNSSFVVDGTYNFKGEYGGSLGKTEVGPISSITGTAAELTLKEIESQKVRKRMKTTNKSSSKGKEIAEKTASSIQYCKKSDGKGWHCKRPAPAHSRLCSYHLAQCRSYGSNLSHKSAADSSLMADSSSINNNNNNNNNNGKNQQVRKTGDSNLYYYYGGFGPCRGKRRGRSAADLVNNVCGSSSIDANVKEDEAEKEDRLDGRESVADECNDENVAGDDEYDLDCSDDGDNSNVDVEETNDIKKDEGEGEKKVLKKRRRKPIKARSLKSLL